MFFIKNENIISADLLSVEEVENIPCWICACGNYWWLRSPSYDSDNVANVDVDGSIEDYGSDIRSAYIAVRPAITVATSFHLQIGETVKVFYKMAQYIGNNKVLLCEPIFRSQFDKNNNTYETSEVKHKLDEWFNQMKSEVK